jgi:signal transduction histidine kinase/DNA-binding response OmpR family regulator
MGYHSTILIVDDEPVGREILGRLLGGTSDGEYDLAFASNGMEALERAAELTPDLILLDVMMPGMNGFEVCQRLRADSVLGEVPVIMLTALDDRDSRLQGIEAGADDFVSKPYDHDELRARVKTITRLNRYRQLLVANRQLERDVAQLSALYDISKGLNYITDIDVLLTFIVRQTKEMLDAAGASIIFHDQEKDELYFRAVAAENNEVEERLGELRFPSDSGVAGWVFGKGEPALVQDVATDERFGRQIDENTGFVTTSLLCVPLNGKEGMLGVLEAVNKGEEFTEDDQHILRAMADNIAVSIEKADLYRGLQEAEELLKEQNSELSETVKALSEAHAELQEMQQMLIQSEKLAALGRFSAGIAHEIKNPLAIILSGIEFLEIKLSNGDTDAKTAVEKVKKTTLRASDILHSLLKFARPSEAKLDEVAPRDLIDDTLSFFEFNAPSKNMDIKTQFVEPDGDTHVKIDKLQIQQVLVNLLMNSMEAMSDGGEIRIRGSLATSPQGQQRYMIEISDTGEGIPEDALPKLFEPFYTSKRDSKGTGLGLSISKTIVDSHGGDLTIESELGKGTTARVMLPLAQGDDRE